MYIFFFFSMVNVCAKFRDKQTIILGVIPKKNFVNEVVNKLIVI